MSKLKATPEWLDAKVFSRPVGVDRKKNILLGYVIAQAGPFKSQGRGEFDRAALEKIVQLGNEKRGGLRSRFTHPDMSSDGLGKFLGRAHGLAIGTALDARTGKMVEAVRGDLHFDKTALEEGPDGGKPLGIYVMDLAESDPDAISSSIVVRVDQEYRRKPDGTLETDEEDNTLPPLWRPKELLASDIVDTGDAVDGLLSAGIDIGELPDGVVRMATLGLNKLFDGAPREVVKARVEAWLGRYLDSRYGPEEFIAAGFDLDDLRRRLEMKAKGW